jgi:hypothetical protein
MLLWLVNCLLWLLVKIVELISHNAYVVVAAEGTGFCSSAATATGLILGNGARMAVLAVVADSLLFLGKLATAASSAFFTFVYLDKTYPKGTFSSPLVPVIVVFLTAYAIASVAFGVVEQAVNATIVIFLDDESKGRADTAPAELREAVGVHAAHEEEMKAKQEKRSGCCSVPKADAPANAV